MENGNRPHESEDIMTEREKLTKEIRTIAMKQHSELRECEDLYPIDGDVLACAYDYIPLKIMKRIIKNNTV